jgi:hypothetical protein
MAERTRWRRDAGQASLELLAGIPALLLAGLIALQLGAAGYAATLADGAAEAGALAVAAGLPPRPAVSEALPGWADERFAIAVDRGNVRVELRAPSPVEGLSRALSVSSSAWARPPKEG